MKRVKFHPNQSSLIKQIDLRISILKLIFKSEHFRQVTGQRMGSSYATIFFIFTF